MKRLILIRHAKTENGFDKKDIDRCLTNAGESDAKKVAEILNQINIIPQLIISSNALRTQQTAKLIIENLNKFQIELILNSNLYNASFNKIVDEIKEIPNELNCVALVAHNPGISDLVNNIKLNTTYNLTPASIVIFDFEADDWCNIFESKSDLNLLSIN